MTTSRAVYRADLHVHSLCSENPTARTIRAFSAHESYTEPLEVYAAAKARGMDFVTITDHNTLAGALAVAHLPGAFLSTEFDTWFPEDGRRVHVVALDIDEPTFAAAERARPSIYELVACLRESGTLHYIAHPLFGMDGDISPDTVEKLLLLFNVLEGRNGSRVPRCNGLLREIAAGLTPEAIAEMAERQGIEPFGPTPWRKSLTGGSDDHSGLNVASAHTAAGGDGTLRGFLDAVAAGDCEAAGEDGSARLLAHSIYAASFWHLRELLRLDEPAPRRRAVKLLRRGFGRIGRDVPVLEKTVRGVRGLAPGLYRGGDRRGPAWEELLEREIGALLACPEGLNAVSGRELDRRLFSVAQRLADDVVSLHLQPLLDPAARLSLKRRLQSLFAVGLVHFLELPYFFAWGFQSRDRAVQEALRRHFLGEEPEAAKVALLADGLDRGQGGTAVDRRCAAAAASRGASVHVLTSVAAPSEAAPSELAPSGRCDGHLNFAPTAWRPPGPRPRGGGARSGLALPPLVEVIDHLEEHGFTAVHVTSPGAMGLVGLVAARLLHLPVTGAFAADPAGSPLPAPGGMARRVGAATRRRGYELWFYRHLDGVVTPSRAAARELVARGLAPGRVRVLPSPEHRGGQGAVEGGTEVEPGG
ncbi:MAG: glycosyltransferase [Thermoleophilia bacterium]